MLGRFGIGEGGGLLPGLDWIGQIGRACFGERGFRKLGLVASPHLLPWAALAAFLQAVNDHLTEVCYALAGRLPKQHMVFPGLRSLLLEGKQLQKGSLDSVSLLTKLKDLTLSGPPHTFPADESRPQNLSPLAHLRGLQSLGLAGMKFANLQAVGEACTGLTQLGLDTGRFDSGPLRSFQRLQTLAVDHHCDRPIPAELVLDVAALTTLTQLSLSAMVPGDQPPVDVAPLAALTGLRDLSLELDVTGAGMQAVARTCTQLTRLRLDGLSGFQQPFTTRDIHGLHHLQSLHIAPCQEGPQLQATLDGLGALTSLTQLSADRVDHLGEERVVDLTPLSSLCRLKELDLPLGTHGACGLRAMGQGCSRLTSLRLVARAGLWAASSGVDVGGSGSSSGMWASLQKIEVTGTVEPGFVASLPLAPGSHLRSWAGLTFFGVDPASAESTPESRLAALRCSTLHWRS